MSEQLGDRVYDFAARYHRRLAQLTEWAALTWLITHRDWIGVALVALLGIAAWFDGLMRGEAR